MKIHGQVPWFMKHKTLSTVILTQNDKSSNSKLISDYVHLLMQCRLQCFVGNKVGKLKLHKAMSQKLNDVKDCGGIMVTTDIV